MGTQTNSVLSLPFSEGDKWSVHLNGIHKETINGLAASEYFEGQQIVNSGREIWFERQEGRQRFTFNFYANGVKRSKEDYVRAKP